MIDNRALIEQFLQTSPAVVITASKPGYRISWNAVLAEAFGCTEPPQKIVVSAVRKEDCWKGASESFTAKQAFATKHKTINVLSTLEQLWDMGFREILMQSNSADLHIQRNSKLSHSTMRSGKPSRTQWGTMLENHQKIQHISPTTHAALLRALDIVSEDGSVRSAMADKYRQLNHVIGMCLELDVVMAAELSPETMFTIVDAGCGKAYVSLALYWVLAERGVNVALLGVDTNSFVIEHCRNVSAQLGMHQARFEVCGIDTAQQSVQSCSLLIALHACDTASDDALVLGLATNATAMLVAPCCHKHLQRQLKTLQVPEFTRPLLRDGITKERIGDILTDSIRRDVLLAFGYRAQLQEFIALEHTAKNVMIKAERVKPENLFIRNAAPQLLQHLVTFASHWGVQPNILQKCLEI